MCAVAIVDDKECASQNELRHALGLQKLPIHSGGPMQHDCCLCPVDMLKAARQAKYFVEYDGNMYWYLRKH